METPVQRRPQVGVECPQCHFRQFVPLESEFMETLLDSKAARLIHAELQAWMATHCPNHLSVVSQLSRN